jgi:hypothetical protein
MVKFELDEKQLLRFFQKTNLIALIELVLMEIDELEQNLKNKE